MITTRQMWELIGIVAAIAVAMLVGFILQRLPERKRRRENLKREAVRSLLIGLSMESLTPTQERAAHEMARAAGLDFDDLDTDTARAVKRLRDRDERDRLDLLAKVKQERVRQEALEAEAIRSILEEMPVPKHDEAHGGPDVQPGKSV
jgi:hypothetical protein